MPSFSERLLAIRTELGSLCIGIDPSEEALTDWGIPDTAEGARDFGYAIISACTNRVGIVKPQVAFFERFGSTGYFALEEVLSAARESNLLIISDAKRGDIGTTMLGYAQAWFGDDSPLRSDALTVSPYLGPSSLSETVEIARDVQGGVFVLAATSNVEAEEVQRAKTGSQSIAARVVRAAQELSDGDVGIVIGATQELSRFGVGSIREKDAAIPILAPGFGFQGAQLSNIADLFGASAQNVIPTLSRGLYQAGPNGVVQAIEALRRQL
jgi:orotidine-5'-phosphate decarboxylase